MWVVAAAAGGARSTENARGSSRRSLILLGRPAYGGGARARQAAAGKILPRREPLCRRELAHPSRREGLACTRSIRVGECGDGPGSKGMTRMACPSPQDPCVTAALLRLQVTPLPARRGFGRRQPCALSCVRSVCSRRLRASSKRQAVVLWRTRLALCPNGPVRTRGKSGPGGLADRQRVPRGIATVEAAHARKAITCVALHLLEL